MLRRKAEVYNFLIDMFEIMVCNGVVVQDTLSSTWQSHNNRYTYTSKVPVVIDGVGFKSRFRFVVLLEVWVSL